MNLSELRLVAWPVQGEAGWQAYKEMAEEYEKQPSSLGERVQFSCEIGITFEAYKHAMLTQIDEADEDGPSTAAPTFHPRMHQINEASRQKMHDLMQ